MRLHNRYIMVAATLFAVLLSGCELFKGEEPTPETTLDVAITAFNINSAGDKIAINITTNADFDYEIMDDADKWIKEEKSNNVFILRFVVAENTDYDGREGQIRIYTLDGKKEKMVKVRQMQQNAIIIAEDEYDFDCAEHSLQFSYNTNVECKIICSEKWLRETTTRGLEQKEVCFTIDENITTEAREATITLACGTIEQQIVVRQEASPERITLIMEHCDAVFYSPWWDGKDVRGSVVWDTGMTPEPWSEGIKYEYPITEAVRTVTFEMENATEFTIAQIGEINSITIYTN